MFIHSQTSSLFHFLFSLFIINFPWCLKFSLLVKNLYLLNFSFVVLNWIVWIWPRLQSQVVYVINESIGEGLRIFHMHGVIRAWNEVDPATQDPILVRGKLVALQNCLRDISLKHMHPVVVAVNKANWQLEFFRS
jgi:hypothetical protein